MNINKRITQILIRHEGLKLKPYRCSSGKLTIGVGRNLDNKGITKKEAKLLLKNDVQECLSDLKKIFNDSKKGFNTLPIFVQIVLIDMRFNLGHTGFLSFKKMITAIKEHEFYQASLEIEDSLYYHQVGKRADNLIKMMQNTVKDFSNIV